MKKVLYGNNNEMRMMKIDVILTILEITVMMGTRKNKVIIKNSAANCCMCAINSTYMFNVV